MTFASLNQNGTPDRWYEGLKRDLWVEFKVVPSIPRSGLVVGKYTENQLRWMERRWHRRFPEADVVGIVGLPDSRAVIQFTPDEWKGGTSIKFALSIKEVAEWISEWCGV